MKRLALALLVVAALGACSHRPYRMVDRLGDQLHTQPLLTVRAGVISVAPEPIVVRFKELRASGTPIVWRLPEGYRFAANGIEIVGVVVDTQGNPVRPDPKVLKDANPRLSPEGRNAFACQANEKDRAEFACRFTDKAAAGVYRYNIRAVDSTGRAVEWDPSVFSID